MEDAPRALVALDARREAEQAHVDGEVDGAADDAQSRGRRARLAGAGRRSQIEKTAAAASEASESVADVEEDVVERAAGARSTRRRDGRERERQRGAIVEERGARERADGADRDRALDLGELERRAPGRRRRARARRAGRRRRCSWPKTSPAMPAADADDADDADDDARGARESEKKRGPCSACGRGWRRSSTASSGSAARQRRDVLAVLAHRAQLRAALGGEQQRLGARAEDAVAALELRAVDGEVGLVDQLVRVDAVLRERRDADRHGRADRLRRGLDLELALGDGAADPLRDLERLLGRRLRQEDRELLAAEARRHVVVAQLLRGRSRRCPAARRRRRGGRSCC